MVPRDEFEYARGLADRRLDALEADCKGIRGDMSTLRDNVRVEVAGGVRSMQALLDGARGETIATHRWHWSQFWVVIGPIVGGAGGSFVLHLLAR